MTRARFAPLGIAALVLALPGTAFAACQEKGRLICGDGAPQISSEAELQVSRGAGFAPLKAGSGLRGGDRVMTGASASTLSLGASCSKSVGAGALVTVSRSGGKTCASVTASAAGDDDALTTGATNRRRPAGAPVDGGGGGGAGTGGGGAVGAANVVPAAPVVSSSALGLGAAAGAAALAAGLGVGLSGGNNNNPTPPVSPR